MLSLKDYKEIEKDISKIYSQLELKIIENIALRLTKINFAKGVVLNNVKVLQQMGLLYNDIIELENIIKLSDTILNYMCAYVLDDETFLVRYQNYRSDSFSYDFLSIVVDIDNDFNVNIGNPVITNSKGLTEDVALEKCLCMCFNNGYYITIENCYILNEESKVFLGLGINNTHTVGHLKNASDKIFGIAHEYGKALEEIDVHRPLINDIKITNNILTEKGENLMTENNENILLEGDSNGK